jgi:hypothetical protein
MKHVCLIGVVMSVVGGSSFLIVTGSDWVERSPAAQYLNLVAWFVGLVGLFSTGISGLLLLLPRAGKE